MKKLNQKGFTPVEWILLLVIVGLVAGIAWYVFKSQNDTTATLENTELSQAQPTKTTSADIVTTKTDSKSGQYLVAANGKALYVSNADTAGTSNCTGTCLDTWPIYAAPKATGTFPDGVTVIKRSDGKLQYAYKDMPLYYYYTDKTDGIASGTAVAGWAVAKP
jgi:predicted lipoprotein with Yx(FWY)xxD motif